MSRILVRNAIEFQAPNTYKITTSEEQKLETGLDNIFIDFNRDGSFTADIELNFLFANTATDFATFTDWFEIAGDYRQLTSTLPAAVDTQITDSWFFANQQEFDAFETQLVFDTMLELKVK